MNRPDMIRLPLLALLGVSAVSVAAQSLAAPPVVVPTMPAPTSPAPGMVQAIPAAPLPAPMPQKY